MHLANQFSGKTVQYPSNAFRPDCGQTDVVQKSARRLRKAPGLVKSWPGLIKRPRQRRRCWAIEAFCLKTGLPDGPVSSDNNSIGVLSPKRPGKHFIFHLRKVSLAYFLPFCRAGSVFNMAAHFGNALEYTAKNVEKGGVEAPRSLTVSTPLLLLSRRCDASG